MNFLFALVILAAAVCGVLVPIFFGYGLAEGRAGPMLLSAGFLGLSGLLFFAVARLRRAGTPPEGGHSTH